MSDGAGRQGRRAAGKLRGHPRRRWTREQAFLDALRDVSQVQYILGLQETIPVAIADGYARATKRPAVASCTPASASATASG